jgi:hypothetical protein
VRLRYKSELLSLNLHGGSTIDADSALGVFAPRECGVSDVSEVLVLIFRAEKEVVTSHRTVLLKVEKDTVLSSKINILCLVDTECCFRERERQILKWTRSISVLITGLPIFTLTQCTAWYYSERRVGWGIGSDPCPRP